MSFLPAWLHKQRRSPTRDSSGPWKFSDARWRFSEGGHLRDGWLPVDAPNGLVVSYGVMRQREWY